MKFTFMGFAKAAAVAVGISYFVWGTDGPGPGEVFQTRGKGGYRDALKDALAESEKKKKGAIM